MILKVTVIDKKAQFVLLSKRQRERREFRDY